MLRFRVVGRYGEMAGHGERCCIIDQPIWAYPLQMRWGVDVLSGVLAAIRVRTISSASSDKQSLALGLLSRAQPTQDILSGLLSTSCPKAPVSATQPIDIM